jgi:hypothetical protein
MFRLFGAALAGLTIGSFSGTVVGVAIDFSHLNMRTPVFFRVALGPSVSGLLLGSILGLLIGLTVGYTKRAGPSG